MPVIAAPYTPLSVAFRAQAPDPFGGIAGMTWTGWDGTEWDLLGRSGGVFLSRDGIRGLSMPRFDRYTSESPALAGSRYRGSRTLERDVFWPLFLFSDEGSRAWQEYDRAFWRTMDPGKVGTWTVVNADGGTRTLPLRFTSDGDHSTPSDPSQRGWDVYAVSLVAEEPYWRGDPITRLFRTTASVPFFGGVTNGFGPAFHISAGSTLATATIDNPGDVEAFPVYKVTGPTTSVSVGVDGKVVTFTGVLLGGQSVTVDTRPDRLTVVDSSGADRIADLTAAEFVPVPAGSEVPLSLSMVGTGSVQVSIEPGWYRAW